MVHQFDHRFATYENATQASLNKGTLPQVSARRDHGTFTCVNLPDATGYAERVVDERLRGRTGGGGWISSAVDASLPQRRLKRTVIASLFPRFPV